MRWSLLAVLVACRPSPSPVPHAPPVASDRDVVLGQAMLAAYRGNVHREPPLALAPTDGSELELRALEAEIAIDGPLAHTELHLTFHNPEPRVREGRFSITLPADAAIARFAMKNDDTWREARIVTREQGRRVYEAFLHKRVDPALLEQDLGNRFSARVFPIAASADKELVIAYDHRVSAADFYTLALKGLPTIAKQRIAIARDGERTTRVLDHHAPDDIVAPVAAGSYAVAAGDAFVARVELPAAGRPAPVERALILVDTSASRAPIMARQADLVQALCAALGNADVIVAAFDHGVTEVYRGRAADATRVAAALEEHGALGASDLGAALAMAANAGMPRVIVVGDGVPTLGEHEPAKLARVLEGSPVERVDAIQVGASLDRATLRAIVGAARVPGAILDGRELAHVTRGLATAVPAEQPIRVAGAREVWPPTTRGLAPGAPVWVAGTRGTTGELAIQIGERTVRLPSHAADATRVRRAVAIAEVAELEDRLAHAAADQQWAIASVLEEVALANNLVSARTSLLVLESDADERRMLGPTTATATAPTIDPTSTTQGITIDKNYIQNIPVPGRTFDSALGAAAGSQGDAIGTSFSGAASLENQYYVDGINAIGLTPGTTDREPATLHDLARAGVDPSIIVDRLNRQALDEQQQPEPPPPPPPTSDTEPVYAGPYTGELQAIMTDLEHGRRGHALERAAHWQLASPGEVAALLALGEALEARGQSELAARAYASIVDLYPSRSELVRAAGERLDRVVGARALAIDAYRRAIRERPDQVSTYRLLAYDLMREDRPAALDLIADAIVRATRPSVRQILEQDLAVISAYLTAHVPDAAALVARYRRAPLPATPSIRFVLSWETDGNDVDLHVRDRFGNHAYYAHRDLTSGGHLLDDVTDGFGPEMLAIDSPKAGPYKLGVHYYARGPEGVGLGSVQIIRHDGHGNVTVEDRPFVIQNDHAYVDLGTAR